MASCRLLLVISLLIHPLVASFIVPRGIEQTALKMASDMANEPQQHPLHPFCLLPGDPALLMTTNADLGTKKLEIMKACSKAIAAATGKPESYVGKSIRGCYTVAHDRQVCHHSTYTIKHNRSSLITSLNKSIHPQRSPLMTMRR